MLVHLLHISVGSAVAAASVLEQLLYVFVMQELVLNRWVSKKERENTEYLLIP